MKVVLYNKDVVTAARMATAIKSIIRGSEVGFVEAVNDEDILLSSVVVADTDGEDTAGWLLNFRRYNRDVPLILVSDDKNVLRGSLTDPCFTLTKPYNPKELIELVALVGSGEPYRMEVSKKRLQ